MATNTVRAGRLAAAVLLALTGIACGDFSGGSSGGSSVQPDAFFDLSANAGGVEAFENTVYPIVVQYCVDCHEGNGPGSPHFAHPTVSTAYQALVAQGKVNLGNPSASRLAIKVGTLNHHCWTPADCPSDGATLAAAIQAWADAVDFGEGGVSVDGALASSTLAMSDGVLDTGSERYSGNLIALWEFKEGTGTVATDTSGFAPPLDLQFQGNVDWITAWGVTFDGGALFGDDDFARKLYDEIANPDTGTQQYTIEAWATPANIDQEGPAVMVSYARNNGSRNTTLGQVKYNYNVRTRSLAGMLESTNNGTPALQTYDADQDAQDRLQHVVVTYDQFRGRRIYVDGVWTDDEDEVGPGRLWNWDPNHDFVLGREANGERAWRGQLRLVAIYRQSLTDDQIQQNFQAGVGQRRLLRFDVSPWMGSPSSVDFVVTDFDPYSYLFCQPTLVTNVPNGSQIANLRIAVNGEVALTGQAFETLDTTSVSPRQELSRQCSVIPKGNLGPDGDTFTLVFEHLGGFQNVVVEDQVAPAPILLDPTPVPVNGTRDFDRIDATFARLTSQPRTVGAATFDETLEQLPSTYDVRSFVSSNQVPIAKLALDYCDAMIEDTAARTSFFPGFDFGDPPETAFSPAGRSLIFVPLYDRLLSDGLVMQPARADVEAELDTLIDALTDDCVNPGDCDATRTATAVKGACTAVLSSAAVTLH